MINNVEDINIAMAMYNLLEYCQNYSMTSGSLWNYYRDKIVDTDDNASSCESFKSCDDGNPQPRPDQPPILPSNAEIVVPLK